MTVAEAQTLRTSVLAAINALLTGGVQSYRLPSGNEVTRLNINDLWKQLQNLDTFIARQSNGMFYVSQFRRSE